MTLKIVRNYCKTWLTSITWRRRQHGQECVRQPILRVLTPYCDVASGSGRPTAQMACRPSLTCSTPQTTTSSTASKPTPTTSYSPTFHTRLTYPNSCATDHTTWHLSIRQNSLITQTVSFVLSISTPILTIYPLTVSHYCHISCPIVCLSCCNGCVHRRNYIEARGGSCLLLISWSFQLEQPCAVNEIKLNLLADSYCQGLQSYSQ